MIVLLARCVARTRGIRNLRLHSQLTNLWGRPFPTVLKYALWQLRFCIDPMFTFGDSTYDGCRKESRARGRGLYRGYIGG